MHNEINNILNELFMLDSELKNQEKEVRIIVEKLIKSQPNVKLDNDFVKKLKTELTKIALEKKQNKETFLTFSFSDFFKSRVFAYSLSSIMLVLLVIMSTTYFSNNQSVTTKTVAQNKFSFNKGLTKLDAYAFGEISINKENASTQPDRGIGGGGSNLVSTESAKMAAPVADKMASSIMPPYNIINYNYVYKGEQLEIKEDKLPVYQRLKGQTNTAGLANIFVDNISSDVFNLKALSNAKVSNLNINEDREFGYSLYFNFDENNFYLGSNWQKWPQPYANCKDDACYKSLQLKESDMLSDEEILNIADAFLKQYNIDMTNYGTGTVDNSWRQYYEEAKQKNEDHSLPDQLQVIYPLKINEQLVYSSWGQPYGISVDVSIRYKKAAGLSSVYAPTFQASDYDTNKDFADIIKQAQDGGMSYNFKSDNPEKTIDIELDTPTLILINYSKYDEKTQTSSDLFIPAYIFPVSEKSQKDNPLIQKSIIVPLIKGLVEKPDIMPLMEKSVR
jgi:hypothetical protein